MFRHYLIPTSACTRLIGNFGIRFLLDTCRGRILANVIWLYNAIRCSHILCKSSRYVQKNLSISFFRDNKLKYPSGSSNVFSDDVVVLRSLVCNCQYLFCPLLNLITQQHYFVNKNSLSQPLTRNNCTSYPMRNYYQQQLPAPVQLLLLPYWNNNNKHVVIIEQHQLLFYFYFY